MRADSGRSYKGFCRAGATVFELLRCFMESDTRVPMSHAFQGSGRDELRFYGLICDGCGSRLRF